jgi:hypothetical protein
MELLVIILSSVLLAIGVYAAFVKYQKSKETKNKKKKQHIKDDWDDFNPDHFMFI